MKTGVEQVGTVYWQLGWLRTYTQLFFDCYAVLGRLLIYAIGRASWSTRARARVACVVEWTQKHVVEDAPVQYHHVAHAVFQGVMSWGRLKSSHPAAHSNVRVRPPRPPRPPVRARGCCCCSRR